MYIIDLSFCCYFVGGNACFNGGKGVSKLYVHVIDIAPCHVHLIILWHWISYKMYKHNRFQLKPPEEIEIQRKLYEEAQQAERERMEQKRVEMAKRRDEMEKQREARRLEQMHEKMDDERGVLKGGVSSTGLDRDDDESEDESSSSDDEESEDESSSDDEEESDDEGDNEADVKEEL